MPIYRIKAPDGNSYDIPGPENATQQQIESEVIRQFPEAAKTKSGLGSVAKTGIALGQGLTFGFADELAGAVSSAFGGDYKKTRDQVRQAQKEFQEEHPVASTATELVGSLPTMLLPGGQIRGATMIAKAGRVLAPAAGYGAIGGIGASEGETASDITKSAAQGATLGSITGGAASATGKVLGMAGTKAGEIFSEKFAVNPARERLAQLLQRDAEAKMLPSAGISQEGPTRAAARLKALSSSASPARAPIAATGQNVMSELDILSQLPGSAQTLLKREQAKLQNQRGPTLIKAAEKSLGTEGKKYNESLEIFSASKKAASEPYYNQLKGLIVQVDPELKMILDRVKKAHGPAEEIATVSGKPVKISDLEVRDITDFEALDTIKKTLWDISKSAKKEGADYRAQVYDEARRDLTEKMDKLSPKENGVSIYKMAREAFSGPAAMEEAAKNGSKAMTMQPDELSKIMSELEGSELEAFRIGAIQSLRQQLGEKAGQTKIIESFDSSNTKNRLRQIFGNNFREFNKAILQEKQLKELQKIGGGSQTFARQAAAEDQSIATQALDAASSISTANPVATISMLSKASKKLGMPENTRNQLAKMLLLKGPEAERELQAISNYMKLKQQRQMEADRLAGLLGAQAARDF